MKGDLPMTVQTSLRNLLQKPSLLVNTPRAREKEEKRRKEGKKGAPSYDTGVQGRTKKEELPAMKASRDTQGRRKVKRGKKERKREGEREGEKRKEKGRCSQLRTNVQRHTSEREG